MRGRLAAGRKPYGKLPIQVDISAPVATPYLARSGVGLPTDFGGGVCQAVEGGALAGRGLAHEPDERIARHTGYAAVGITRKRRTGQIRVLVRAGGEAGRTLAKGGPRRFKSGSRDAGVLLFFFFFALFYLATKQEGRHEISGLAEGQLG